MLTWRFRFEKTRGSSFKNTSQTTPIIAATLAPLQPHACATGHISRHSLTEAQFGERAANERRRRELSGHGSSNQRRGARAQPRT